MFARKTPGVLKAKDVLVAETSLMDRIKPKGHPGSWKRQRWHKDRSPAPKKPKPRKKVMRDYRQRAEPPPPPAFKPKLFPILTAKDCAPPKPKKARRRSRPPVLRPGEQIGASGVRTFQTQMSDISGAVFTKRVEALGYGFTGFMSRTGLSSSYMRKFRAAPVGGIPIVVIRALEFEETIRALNQMTAADKNHQYRNSALYGQVGTLLNDHIKRVEPVR